MAGYDDEEYAQYGSSFQDEGKLAADDHPIAASHHHHHHHHHHHQGEVAKPRVLLMGLKKSGKSSI